MFPSLRVQNYRAFEDFRLEPLRRVNLLLGRNNSGKSSLLEAVYLLACGADPAALAKVAFQRGELWLPEGRTRPLPVVSHLFLGHNAAPKSSFNISADGSIHFKAIIKKQRDPQALLPSVEDPLNLTMETEFPFQLSVRSDTPTGQPNDFTIPITSNGMLEHLPLRTYRPGSSTLPPIEFISPESLNIQPMSSMWDSVLRDGREDEVVEAMRILDPRIQSIAFQTGGTGGGFPRTGALVGFQGSRKRVPLGSQGEGSRRLLALSLSLIQTSGGYLLIDEIDTGLHWSIMADMWQLVIETARRHDIQVFATTHSSDCIRSLDQICRECPELASDVSAHTINRELTRSIPLNADELHTAIDQQIEVRG